ncbi:MAG: hypothetical protein V4574_07615 [Pseudomonadota bacterium]
MRMTIAIGLTALLAGCGGASTTATSTSTSTTTTTANTTDATATTVAALTGGVEGSNDCGKNPDFAPIYAGGAITTCSSAHFDATHKTSGSVSYTTPTAPAAVLAWSKEQAAASGLSQRLANPTMISFGEGAKRSLVVIALAEGAGSRVTVNWTKAD